LTDAANVAQNWPVATMEADGYEWHSALLLCMPEMMMMMMMVVVVKGVDAVWLGR